MAEVFTICVHPYSLAPALSHCKTLYDPKTDWHTYRAEFKGNTIRLLVDGATVVETSDNRHLTGGGIGLWCKTAQINVRSFKVVAL